MNLFWVRLKMAKSGYIVFVLVFAGLILIPLINNITDIVSNTANPYNDISDLSGFLLFGVVIGLIVGVIIYRTTNVKLSVFPQTNNSRLISSLLMNYFTVVMILMMILVMYMVNLGVFKLMSAFSYDIVFALNIDFKFIITGFFVYLAYGFLLVSIIEFIGAVLRKWTYYAAIILTALFALFIVNFQRVLGHLPGVLAFLVAEPSPLLFFLKATGLWLAITAVTLVINRYTVFYKSHNQILKKGVVITCIVIAATVIIIPGALFEVSYSSGDVFDDDGTFTLNEHDYVSIEEFTIDISHLRNGSRVDIDGTNIYIMQPESWIWQTNGSAIVSNAESLYNIHGDTIVIWYRPAWFLVNGIDVLKYNNQQLYVHLEGNTLFLNYSYDNVHVMLLPIWSLARQFDSFKDTGVLSANVLGFSTGGNSTTNIWIDVE
jgi:hypothetical protein